MSGERVREVLDDNAKQIQGIVSEALTITDDFVVLVFVKDATPTMVKWMPRADFIRADKRMDVMPHASSGDGPTNCFWVVIVDDNVDNCVVGKGLYFRTSDMAMA